MSLFSAITGTFLKTPLNVLNNVLDGSNRAAQDEDAFYQQLYNLVMVQKAGDAIGKFDKDGDGQISAKELPIAPDQFKAMDVDQDGKISVIEMSQVMSNMDVNKDLYLSNIEKKSFFDSTG